MVNQSLVSPCERLRAIKPEDEWWFYQCAADTLEDTTGSKDDIMNTLFHLQAIFNNKWYVKYGNIRNGGICALALLGGMQNTSGNIMRIASNISRLGGIAKLGKKTIKSLRNRDVAQCLDTILEIEVLSCFAEEGFPLTPYPVLDNGRIPDAKVVIDEMDIYVEITAIRWPRPEDFPGQNWKPKQGSKVIERCIEEVSQLPLSQCGIVIVNPPTLFDEEIGRTIMETMKAWFSPELYTKLSGIIIANKRIERSGFIKAQPIPIVNIHASNRCDSQLAKLAEALWKNPKSI